MNCMTYIAQYNVFAQCILYKAMLAIKWLRILSMSSNDKIRNYLVANPIQT